MKFYIDYQLKVTTARVIEAETEEDAIRIANEMVSDDEYWDSVIESMDDFENYRSKNCEFVCLGSAPDDYEADNE